MPLVLCVFPRGKLWDLYSRLPSLAFDITWLAAREEQLIDEHLVSLGRRSALERAAYLLLHLFVRADEAGLVKNGSIQFPFTQQHLADTLGMSLVHTNKTLKRLLRTKTVHWKDRLFEIIDRTAPHSPASPAAMLPLIDPGPLFEVERMVLGLHTRGKSGQINRGKLPILFSLAASCQQRPIAFAPPLEFYLQKISINRVYAVIPFHNLALNPACRWTHRPAHEHRLPCPRPRVP